MANLNFLLTRYASGEFEEVAEGRVSRAGQTLTCVHCGTMWEVHRHSGIHRGWCWRCQGPTCGGKPCRTCRPLEKQLAVMEQRQALRRAMEESGG